MVGNILFTDNKVVIMNVFNELVYLCNAIMHIYTSVCEILLQLCE